MFRKSCMTIVCVFVASILFMMPVYASETAKESFAYSAANSTGKGTMAAPMAAAVTDQKAADEQERIGGTAYCVTAKTANVMSGPGDGYTILATLQKGSIVYVLSINNGWAKVTYSGKNAYVKKSKITKQ